MEGDITISDNFDEYYNSIKKAVKDRNLVKKIKNNLKNQIKTTKDPLFQIPFTKDQIKLYRLVSYNSKKPIKNGALQTLAILRLRSYSLALQDSNRMIQMYTNHYDRGIKDTDTIKYLSTIFDTNFNFYHKNKINLKEGYATIMLVHYFKEGDLRVWSSILIVYKEKGIIHYYDTTTNTHTVSIDKIMKKCKTTEFLDNFYFYKNPCEFVLNKNKMVAPIQY